MFLNHKHIYFFSFAILATISAIAMQREQTKTQRDSQAALNSPLLKEGVTKQALRRESPASQSQPKINLSEKRMSMAIRQSIMMGENSQNSSAIHLTWKTKFKIAIAFYEGDTYIPRNFESAKTAFQEIARQEEDPFLKHDSRLKLAELNLNNNNPNAQVMEAKRDVNLVLMEVGAELPRTRAELARKRKQLPPEKLAGQRETEYVMNTSGIDIYRDEAETLEAFTKLIIIEAHGYVCWGNVCLKQDDKKEALESFEKAHAAISALDAAGHIDEIKRIKADSAYNVAHLLFDSALGDEKVKKRVISLYAYAAENHDSIDVKAQVQCSLTQLKSEDTAEVTRLFELAAAQNENRKCQCVAKFKLAERNLKGIDGTNILDLRRSSRLLTEVYFSTDEKKILQWVTDLVTVTKKTGTALEVELEFVESQKAELKKTEATESKEKKEIFPDPTEDRPAGYSLYQLVPIAKSFYYGTPIVDKDLKLAFACFKRILDGSRDSLLLRIEGLLGLAMLDHDEGTKLLNMGDSNAENKRTGVEKLNVAFGRFEEIVNAVNNEFDLEQKRYGFLKPNRARDVEVCTKNPIKRIRSKAAGYLGNKHAKGLLGPRNIEKAKEYYEIAEQKIERKNVSDLPDDLKISSSASFWLANYYKERGEWTRVEKLCFFVNDYGDSISEKAQAWYILAQRQKDINNRAGFLKKVVAQNENKELKIRALEELIALEKKLPNALNNLLAEEKVAEKDEDKEIIWARIAELYEIKDEQDYRAWKYMDKFKQKMDAGQDKNPYAKAMVLLLYGKYYMQGLGFTGGKNFSLARQLLGKVADQDANLKAKRDASALLKQIEGKV